MNCTAMLRMTFRNFEFSLLFLDFLDFKHWLLYLLFWSMINKIKTSYAQSKIEYENNLCALNIKSKEQSVPTFWFNWYRWQNLNITILGRPKSGSEKLFWAIQILAESPDLTSWLAHFARLFLIATQLSY